MSKEGTLSYRQPSRAASMFLSSPPLTPGVVALAGVKTWKEGPRAGREWVAYIYLKQVYTEIGVYKTQEEAARAYDR